MSNMGKLELQRYGGAKWALERIDRLGLEEAKKEFAWRGVMNAPLNIEVPEIRRFEKELKENCKRTMCAMACMVLHDEFGFSKVRIERFIARWNMKVDCMAEDLTDWDDYAEILKEECGVDVDIPICYRRNSE